MTRTHAPSETEKLIADLTSRLAENEAEIAYLHTQFQRLASPVPEITFESNKVSGGGAGSTTLVNGFKGNVTIAAGTYISILNSTNVITIANTYTLPNTVLTNTSTYVKGIAAGTNISFSTTANIIKINNTYTLPASVLTSASTYVKSLVAGTNISITSTAHTFTITNTYTLPATVLTNTSTYVKSINTLDGVIKLAAGTGVTITTTATTKTLTLSASASGGGNNYSFYFNSTASNTTIAPIGTIKTGSNGIITCKVAFRFSTTAEPYNYYFQTSSGNISDFSVFISTKAGYLTYGKVSTGSATRAGGIVYGNFTGLTANTTYTVNIANTAIIKIEGYYAELMGA